MRRSTGHRDEQRSGVCCGRSLLFSLILWLLGLVSSYTLAGFIHILLIIAIVVLVIRVIQGRRALQQYWLEALHKGQWFP